MQPTPTMEIVIMCFICNMAQVPIRIAINPLDLDDPVSAHVQGADEQEQNEPGHDGQDSHEQDPNDNPTLFDTNFPQLASTLYHFSLHATTLTKSDVENILLVFVHTAFNTLSAYQYLTPWLPESTRASNREGDWAMNYAEEAFKNAPETAPLHLRMFLEEIDFLAIFRMLMREFLPAARNQVGDEYLGWRLFRWIYDTATQPDVSGCDFSMEVLESWVEGGNVGTRVRDFRPSCWRSEIPWARLEQEEEDAEDGDQEFYSDYYDDGGESDFEAPGVIVGRAKVDITQHSKPHAPASDTPLTMCIICRCYDEPDNMVPLYSCGHLFHSECFEGWVIHCPNQLTCPLCRRAVYQSEPVDTPLLSDIFDDDDRSYHTAREFSYENDYAAGDPSPPPSPPPGLAYSSPSSNPSTGPTTPTESDVDSDTESDTESDTSVASTDEFEALLRTEWQTDGLTTSLRLLEFLPQDRTVPIRSRRSLNAEIRVNMVGAAGAVDVLQGQGVVIEESGPDMEAALRSETLSFGSRMSDAEIQDQ